MDDYDDGHVHGCMAFALLLGCLFTLVLVVLFVVVAFRWVGSWFMV